ncbi:MAG: protoheme IX farnesyltransferase [archaeon]|nr:protoheme IX farnesyltransferase [archaeon]
MEISAYWQLTKPRITFAILSLYLLSVFTSTSGNLANFGRSLLGAVAVFISAASSNALNCYIDQDIDRIMARTKRRPIPSGKIKAKDAFTFGMLSMLVSVIITYFLGYPAVFLLFLGLFSYIILYTLLLKRRSFLNVFATAPAVATPVWFGWVIGRGTLDFQGFLMGFLVVLWGPLHLWSLATAFVKDYEKVNVPMMPSIVGRQKACWYTLVLSIILSFASILIFFLGYYGLVYLIGVAILDAMLIFLNIRVILHPTSRRSWILYKFSAPYIVGLFFMTIF